jgi:hypothetical protein
MAVQALCVRETVKVGLTARPALAEERASSSRPSWARAAAKLRVCDQIISADFDRSSKPRDCAVITCREASSHSLQNSSMYGHWYRSGRGARPTICLFGATDENFAKSDKGMGAVARFRSSSSARSHSAMPCGARLVNISTSQQPVAAGVVWNGRRGFGQLPFGRRQGRCGIGHKQICAPAHVQAADPITVSTLSGSTDIAHASQLSGCLESRWNCRLVGGQDFEAALEAGPGSARLAPPEFLAPRGSDASCANRSLTKVNSG